MALETKLILRHVKFFGDDQVKGSVLSLNELDNNFSYLKGETVYATSTSGSTVVLHKLNGDILTFPVGSNSSITGGTVVITATTQHGGQIIFSGNGDTFYVDLRPMAGSGLTIDNTSGQYMLDLGTTLPTPSITSYWSWMEHDNITPLGSSNNKNITVPHGSYVDLNSSQFQYSLNPTDVQPQSITGDYGIIDNGPTVLTPLTPITENGITTNTTKTVNFSKPASGLQVVSGQIQFATGTDYSSDSSRVIFANDWFFGYNTSQTPTTTQLESMIVGGLVNDNPSSVTKNNATAPSGEYTIIAYPITFGLLSNIIMDGAASILGAFTQGSNMDLVNSAGLVVTCFTYYSNAQQAFTNNNLLFIF